MTRIKEIKFNKKETIMDTNDKNEKNLTKYITTTDNKSQISQLSQSSNKFNLKDIDKDILLTNPQEPNPNQNQINNIKTHETTKDLAIKRNNTNSELPEKVQILSLQNNINTKSKNKNNKSAKLEFNSKIKKNEKICRICYMEEDDPKENPIVQPCHCSGSCKYIHLQCLKHWIMTKSCVKIDESEFCCVYIFSETECELCKAKLPDLICHNNKLYSLLDFSEDFKNYLILECLTLDKENNKFLYIISLEKKGDIKIGRGQVCDILFSDASVSRIHCVLSVEGKSVYLKDFGSKFGTLILIQTPIINLTENLPLFIQVGRSFLNFLAIDANPKFFNCCGVSEKPMVSYYYQQNQKKLRDNRIFTVKTEGNDDAEINNNEKEEKKEIEENNNDIDIKVSRSNNNESKENKDNNNDNESEIIVDINEDVNNRGDIYEEINDEMVIQ